MADKESLIQKAKLCEAEERWQDMALCMKEVVEMGEELTAEERNLLALAYNNMVGSRRAALRTIASAEQKAADGSEKQKVVTEMKEMCGEFVALLDKFLIPTCNHDEGKVFYQRFKADYLRYLAEISEGEEQENMVTKAKESYEKAHEMAAKLKAAHPIRLKVALNFALFHYEIRKNPQEAFQLALKAFEDSTADPGGINENSYKDSTLIMQQLRDNATLWNSETEDQG
uniref:14-3-3 domain-containing protein n=1 Tax=Branchiostoma floridae TaxID=7739 RepID=C3ZPM2_BRAFL|eukprot:XP_002589508.1 hypothetical protein BRAFLDRAFT_115103 [Branchiostoma floridae]